MATNLVSAQVLFYLDKMVGVLVKQLEEEGWLENSIIVLASDNGGCPTNGGSNHPLRGVKHSYWEGGNKVRGCDHEARGGLHGNQQVYALREL